MTGAKIRSLDEAIAWRNQVAGRVVLTNGVFDILHAGHVHLVERARQLGSALIVAVNDDDSARRLGRGGQKGGGGIAP